ncbi:MAG: LptF/LptG family permease, partial [Flavobacteriaceae bacterium]|nr:LptF/LptG family permease [Flavobacteriaceae bacterium]
MLRNKNKLDAVLSYYLDFTVHFANLLFPLFVFLSVIWFTSKMANNTEIIAILSSGVSYNRFLKPYFIGIGILAAVSLLMGMYLVPDASRGYNDFVYKYVSSTSPTNGQNIYRQINPNEIIYVNSFNPDTKIGTYFT